ARCAGRGGSGPSRRAGALASMLTEHFTPDAARDLPGPEWLVERRVAAAERLADVSWPTDAEEIWRYSRIGELDLDRFAPVPRELLGEPGVEPAPGGGPGRAE